MRANILVVLPENVLLRFDDNLWFFADCNNRRNSQDFPTDVAALVSWRENTIIWEAWDKQIRPNVEIGSLLFQMFLGHEKQTKE